jgi:hypothetical protein
MRSGKTGNRKANLEILYNFIPSLTRKAGSIGDGGSNDSTESNQASVAGARDAIARSFLRLARTDGGIFERLGRYERNQTVRTVLLLNVMSRQVNDDGPKSSPTYLRFGTAEDVSASPLTAC